MATCVGPSDRGAAGPATRPQAPCARAKAAAPGSGRRRSCPHPRRIGHRGRTGAISAGSTASPSRPRDERPAGPRGRLPDRCPLRPAARAVDAPRRPKRKQARCSLASGEIAVRLPQASPPTSCRRPGVAGRPRPRREQNRCPHRGPSRHQGKPHPSRSEAGSGCRPQFPSTPRPARPAATVGQRQTTARRAVRSPTVAGREPGCRCRRARGFPCGSRAATTGHRAQPPAPGSLEPRRAPISPPPTPSGSPPRQGRSVKTGVQRPVRSRQNRPTLPPAPIAAGRRAAPRAVARQAAPSGRSPASRRLHRTPQTHRHDGGRHPRVPPPASTRRPPPRSVLTRPDHNSRRG